MTVYVTRPCGESLLHWQVIDLGDCASPWGRYARIVAFDHPVGGHRHPEDAVCWELAASPSGPWLYPFTSKVSGAACRELQGARVVQFDIHGDPVEAKAPPESGGDLLRSVDRINARRGNLLRSVDRINARRGPLIRKGDSRTDEEEAEFQALQKELRALVTIPDPPPAPGDAEGATAAAALAKAEAAFGGSVITPLTPATTSAFVTVASFTPSPGSAFVVRGVGVWGHDLRAMRDLIRWRVSIGGSVISDERELGMIGSLDNPTLVYGVAREGQTLTVDARNLDERSPSLVEVAVFGWEFPVDGAAGDSLASLMDPRG